MERLEPDALADRAPVFIATSMREARRIEALLSGHGIDYLVEVESLGTSLFGSPRHGAAFYVPAGQADFCREQITMAGLAHGVIEAPA